MKNFYLILLLSLTFASCKKEATVWESDWNAPLVSDTLTLANLVNDSTLSVSSGYYAIDLTRTLFDLSINDVVDIPDTTIAQNYTSAINLEVQPNTTFAGSVETFTLELEDLQLKQVTLREGYIDLRVQNPVETIAYCLIKLPKVKKDGVPLQKLIAAPAANGSTDGVVTSTIDLAGYTLDLTGITGGSYNELLTDFSVTTDPSGPAAWLYNTDVTRVKVTIRDASIFYAQGYFGSRVLSDTTEVDLTMLDVYESGMLDIDNLNLSFEVENGIKVGALAKILNVVSENAQGSSVALAGPNVGNNITVNPATGGWGTLTPSLTNLNFNSSNSNIEAYFENLGTKHKIGYYFQLNPWGNVSGGWDQIFPDSRVIVKMKAQMPLSLGLHDLVLKDTFDISLNQDPEKTRVVSGDLILKAKNGFPMNAEVTAYLLNANGSILHTISGSEKIESSQYGSLDSQTGILVKTSDVVFLLTKEMVDDVNDVTQIVVKAKFNSPDATTGMSQMMLIPEKAFLGIKLKSEFKTENKF